MYKPVAWPSCIHAVAFQKTCKFIKHRGVFCTINQREKKPGRKARSHPQSYPYDQPIFSDHRVLSVGLSSKISMTLPRFQSSLS